MKNRLWVILAVAGVLALAGTAGAQPPPGTLIKQVSMPRLGGGTEKLLGDGQVNVIFFFEPGQPHSIDALQMMHQCEQEFAKKPVHWAAIVSDLASAQTAGADIKAAGLQMPVLIDKGDTLYAQLLVKLHPVVVITDKQSKMDAFAPYQRINYCNVVRAHVQHALGELDDKGLDAVVNPAASTQGGDGAVAQRELRMGQRHLEAKRFPQAAAAANKAIALDAKLVDAQVLLGQALAGQGDCKGAGAAFDKALALDKSNAAAQEGKKACTK